jgi:hypothetical protein
LASVSFNEMIENIRYDHDVRLDKISDHSLMIVEWSF